jgi:hypothetical protein
MKYEFLVIPGNGRLDERYSSSRLYSTSRYEAIDRKQDDVITRILNLRRTAELVISHGMQALFAKSRLIVIDII